VYRSPAKFSTGFSTDICTLSTDNRGFSTALGKLKKAIAIWVKDLLMSGQFYVGKLLKGLNYEVM
jgi:hypothetical protein